MSSIFNTLHIGYSGLSAAQVGINTTGNNLSNAETEGYTRQRVVQSAQTPLFSSDGNVGNGVVVTDIARVFDNFVFDRYTSVSADKDYADFTEKTLTELSSYFPEIDGVGIKADLANYYNMWQTFADNPDTDAIKVALVKQTETLTQHINQTQLQVTSLQSQLNDQLATDVNQVNSLAKELAGVNKSIDAAEAGDVYTASDLRDRRNVLERSLARLIGSKVNQGQLEANIQIDSNSNTRTGSYTLSVNGFNIVDGSTFHPLKLKNDENNKGYYSVSFERQDGALIPMEENISGGKVGAIFDLRGGTLDTTTGDPTDGVVQTVVSQLDSFAKGLIEATNNLYSASTTTKMQSNLLKTPDSTALVSSDLNIREGAFDIVVFDIDGNEVARRDIGIDSATAMAGSTNSIESKIAAVVDDNNDGNANNNINNFINFNYQTASDGTKRLELGLFSLAESQGYTFSIQDQLPSGDFSSGTNFSGATGVGGFFDGDSASNIRIHEAFKNNPTLVTAGESGTAGDNRVALNIVQQQFEKYNFKVDNNSYDTTTYGMFDVISTNVGISTNTAKSRNETVSTQFNATELEYFSTSKVGVDEELTNLIKYQTSYGAAAKLITTIDQMMQTLLGMKQ